MFGKSCWANDCGFELPIDVFFIELDNYNQRLIFETKY